MMKKKRERDEIFSKAVRAGKRTYFFDVKATRRNDYYLTITESKKRYDPNGRYHFEKHKLFLYKEDFDKFAEGLTEVVDYIKSNQPEQIAEDVDVNASVETKADLDVANTSNDSEQFTNVEFEDLKESN
jgi:uncharacterized protein DUF3276